MNLLEGLNRGARRVLIARGVRSSMGQFGGHPAHYYSLEGKRGSAPLVLVHGLGGSANGFFKIFLPLARRFSRVLALDLPGNGFSPLPPAGPLSLEAQLEVLRDFCTRQVGEPAMVVGNSLGGAMAASLAASSPEKVRALVLVSPAGARMTPERTQALMASFVVSNAREARALTRRLFDRAPWAPLLLAPQLMTFNDSDILVYPYEVSEGAKAFVAHDKVTPTVRQLTSNIRPDDALSPHTLGSLTLPMLLLWGEGEKLLPYEGIDYFRAHLPPSAEIEVVKGFGHLPQVERPDQLISRLVAFADRHRV